MDNITTIFREKKLKLTPQRIAVYKYLKSTKEHPSAEVIYKALQPTYPTMSLATIYKALKTELNVGEGNFRYDGNMVEHPHVQCISCGKVDDIEGINFSNVNEDVKQYTSYEVLASKIYFYGLCENCKK
jgi:Fur family peroxide stress response transcriptional regulator